MQKDRIEHSKRNMRMVLLGLQHYSDRYGVLPAPIAVNRNMKPIHSWRTAILPLICQETFYAELDPQNRAWNEGDSSDFRQIEMPIYSSPRTETSCEWCSCYALVVGNGTIFENHTKFELESYEGPNFPTQLTGLLIELPESDIEWMEPRDVTVDEAIAIIRNSKLRGGTLVGFSNTQVQAISANTSAEEIRSLFSPTE